MSDPLAPRGHDPVIVAESASMRRVVDLARRFAPTNLPMLLVGETGVGKEVMAQAIHSWSRRQGELVDVDCGALAPGMVVAELFGHRRGAYTSATESMPGLLEQATRGTLFLDELGSLSNDGQAALLRVLETGEVRRVGDRAKQAIDIRLLAAVQDLTPGAHHLGGVRLDLFHRLAGTVIQIPALRERPEDLLPLARHIARPIGRTVAASVRELLERHAWPGNVRELRNLIVRAASLTSEIEIHSGNVAEAMDLGVGHRIRHAWPGSPVGGSPGLDELIELGRRHAGRPEAMAAELRISRSTLFRRLKGMGISLRGFISESERLEVS